MSGRQPGATRAAVFAGFFATLELMLRSVPDQENVLRFFDFCNTFWERVIGCNTSANTGRSRGQKGLEAA
jgi:hypothetical protein